MQIPVSRVVRGGLYYPNRFFGAAWSPLMELVASDQGIEFHPWLRLPRAVRWLLGPTIRFRWDELASLQRVRVFPSFGAGIQVQASAAWRGRLIFVASRKSVDSLLNQLTNPGPRIDRTAKLVAPWPRGR